MIRRQVHRQIRQCRSPKKLPEFPITHIDAAVGNSLAKKLFQFVTSATLSKQASKTRFFPPRWQPALAQSRVEQSPAGCKLSGLPPYACFPPVQRERRQAPIHSNPKERHMDQDHSGHCGLGCGARQDKLPARSVSAHQGTPRRQEGHPRDGPHRCSPRPSTCCAMARSAQTSVPNTSTAKTSPRPSDACSSGSKISSAMFPNWLTWRKLPSRPAIVNTNIRYV